MRRSATATLADAEGWVTWTLSADAFDGRDTLRLFSALGSDEVTGLPVDDIPLDPDHRRARLRVTLVPMTYRSATCVADSTTAIGEQISKIRSRVLAFNPVQEVIVDIRRTPIAIVDDESFIPAALAKVGDARDADSPDPDIYYIGVIDDCTRMPVPGSRGASITSEVPPTAEAAERRS